MYMPYTNNALYMKTRKQDWGLRVFKAPPHNFLHRHLFILTLRIFLRLFAHKLSIYLQIKFQQTIRPWAQIWVF